MEIPRIFLIGKAFLTATDADTEVRKFEKEFLKNTIFSKIHHFSSIF